MSKKIKFNVAYCSSSDDGYGPEELESSNHSLHTKGWQSCRWCEFPQILILQLEEPADVRKIQILSHQSKISSSIEVYVGQGGQNFRNTTYSRLGYLSLDSNERSRFKARELKSVYVNTRGQFLKLVIKKCHVNDVNIYNQVGIVAINIGGTSAGSSAMDSLAANMSVDGKTNETIRDLMAQKQMAVQQEDYEEASRLKAAIDRLKQSGSQIAELEQAKRAAVDAEDYARAHQIKLEIDQLRNLSLNGGDSGALTHYNNNANNNNNGYFESRMNTGATHRSAANTRLGTGASSIPPSMGGNPSAASGGGGGGGSSRGSDRKYNSSTAGTSSRHGSAANSRPPPSSSGANGSRRSSRSQSRGQDDRHHASSLRHDEQALPHQQPPPSSNSRLPTHNNNKNNNNNFTHADDRPLNNSNHRRASIPDERPIHGMNAGGGSAVSYDDRPIGGGGGDLDNPFGSSSVPPSASGLSSAHSHSQQDGKAVRLSAKDQKEAEPISEVYGQEITHALFSKSWNSRAHALEQMKQQLDSDSLQAHSPGAVFGATCKAILKAFHDRVGQVYIQGCLLLQTLVDIHARSYHGAGGDLRPAIKSLLEWVGSSNQKGREQAENTLLLLAFHPDLEPSLICNAATAPLSKKHASKPLMIRGRVGLLIHLVGRFGFERHAGLSLKSVMELVLPNLEHRSAEVRDICHNLTSMCYILNGKQTKGLVRHLRPSVLDILNASFQDIDQGKLILDDFVQDERNKKHGGHRSAATGGSDRKRRNPRESKAPINNEYQHPRHQAAPMPGGGGHGVVTDRMRADLVNDSSQPAAGGPDAHPDDAEGEGEGKCHFCGEEDPSFTFVKLDIHYWQDCPMLIPCKQCEQVIEICTLNEHFLGECEVAGTHDQCPRCQEAIPVKTYQSHVAAKKCTKAKPLSQANRCPLCHKDIPPGAEGWKVHLLDETCPRNPRRPNKV